MAEDTIDLIEESNDEVENWIHYNNDIESSEKSEINSFINVNADQVIHLDSTGLAIHENAQSFQYDCGDNLLSNDIEKQNLQGDRDKNEQEPLPQDSVDDTSDHNLILKETIVESGQLVEEYFCQKCIMSFNSIEDFLNYHPDLELLNKNPLMEEQLQQNQPEQTVAVSNNNLWDLVENLDEVEKSDDAEDDVEIKTVIAQQNCNSSEEREISNNAIEMDNERYFCYDCQQVFADLTTAENHNCNTQTQRSPDLAEQNSTLSADHDIDNNVYKCHLCDKDYPSLRSFNNHQRWHKKSENFFGLKTFRDEPAICEKCNTIFASEKNLKLHMKMHKKHSMKTIQDALPVGAQSEYNELSQFFCEICSKSFDQKLLIIHKNMHQNLEEYSCGKCNKKFENLPSYEIHMQIHSDSVHSRNTAKKSSDMKLGQEESSKSSEGTMSDGKRKHACQYCGKEFQRPYEKVKHERIHTGEKPYECEVCGKTFRVSYSLTLHLRTHTDIRPYVCATCNKRFKQQSVYVHHLKTHEVECAYKCDICGKSFRTSVQLSGHKNIHIKPYNCTECNRPFASFYAVKVHMKTHNKCHKSNKNRCSICGASYARVFALSLHIKEQHGIDVEPMQLLATTTVNKQKKIDNERVLLMNSAAVDTNKQIHNIDDDREYNDIDSENIVVENENLEGLSNHVDHEENIQNYLPNNVYIDETEAATQAILNTEEISVDNFPAEEIIIDWLSK